MKKKPDDLSEAIKDAVNIEYALHFDQSPEVQADVVPADPINMLNSGAKHSGHMLNSRKQ